MCAHVVKLDDNVKIYISKQPGLPLWVSSGSKQVNEWTIPEYPIRKKAINVSLKLFVLSMKF